MNGIWTDSTVNYTQTVNTDPADAARLTNKPGDGKFDQTTIPGTVELQVGRVDLANMPGRTTWGAPATFLSEQELLRQYLGKDHNYRAGLMSVQRRAIIGDYFGVRGGEAFSSSAYGAATTFFGANNITNLNVQFNDSRAFGFRSSPRTTTSSPTVAARPSGRWSGGIEVATARYDCSWSHTSPFQHGFSTRWNDGDRLGFGRGATSEDLQQIAAAAPQRRRRGSCSGRAAEPKRLPGR